MSAALPPPLPPPAPAPIELRSSPARTLKLLLGCAVFVAIGVAMVATGKGIGWLVIACFGLGIIVSVALLVRPSGLTIGADEMVSIHFARRTTFRFVDCGPFNVWRNTFGAGQKLVVFDHAASVGRTIGRVSRGLSGGSAALPETYGMKADELADLLNRHREAALTRAGAG